MRTLLCRLFRCRPPEPPRPAPVCRDCRYRVDSDHGVDAQYSRCHAPQNVADVTLEHSLVTGKPKGDDYGTWKQQFCSNARLFDDYCGKRGKWFAPIDERLRKAEADAKLWKERAQGAAARITQLEAALPKEKRR